MKATISIEQLAERLDKQVWVKEDLKRIYLPDEGYNTKKMSTKTFIYEKDGEFLVSCFIECPSQPYSWVKSQQEDVKKGVYLKIEECQNEDFGKEENKEDTQVVPNVTSATTVKSEQPKKDFIKEFEENGKYQHPKFGIGIVISEDENTVALKFENATKILLKKVAPLTKI